MSYANRPHRFPTYIPVVVSHAGAKQSGTIVDINAMGACVAGVQNLARDSVIHLRGAVETNLATVRWHALDRAGVYFETPLMPEYLAMLRLRGAAYHITQPSELRAG